MGKNRIFRSVWVRLGLGVLGYEAVLVILTLLLHRYWILQNVSLGDAFFMMGVLACAIASMGMLRSPYGEMLSPWGVPAHPIQATEEEKRRQLLADFVERRHFVVRLLSAGLLNILLSLIVLYIK
jgi:hypothetical protein